MAKKNRSRDEFYSFFARKGDSGKDAHHLFRPKKRSFIPRLLTIIFLILLGVSAWYGYTFFSPRVQQGNDALSVDIIGSPSLFAGELIEYRVVIKNNDGMDFSHGDLFLEYPQNFILLQTDPQAQSSKKNFWNLGTLSKGSTTTIHIKGFITGHEQQDATINASLQYEQPQYHSSFVIKKSFNSHIEPSKQELLSIEGTQSIRPNDHVSYSVHYQDIRLFPNPDALHIKIQIPQSIHIDRRKPEASDPKNNNWDGKALQDALKSDGTGGSITLDGTTDQTMPDTQSIVTQLFFTNPDGTDVLLAEKKYDITLAHGDLSLSLNVADVPDGPLQLGQAIPCTIVFENKGSRTLNNTLISLTSESPLIDWEVSDASGGKKEGSSLKWTKDSHKELASIDPGGKGTMRCSLALKDKEKLTDAILHPSTGTLGVTFQLQAASESATGGSDTSSKNGLVTQIAPTTLQVLSDAKISAFVRHITSSGNTSSVLRVNLALTNTLHDISGIQIKAHIGMVGDWVSQSTRSAGDISYTADKKEVVWTLNKMPSSVHRIDASFDLSVPQNFNDTAVVIIDTVTFTAKDSIVNAPITQTLKNLKLLIGND